MKNIFVCLWVGMAFLALMSCGGEGSVVDQSATFPKEARQPEGARFDYLMFENDYNAVPKKANPKEYSKEVRYSDDAGMSFSLSNQRQFGPGVNAIISKPKAGEFYKVSFECMKPKEMVQKPMDQKGYLVLSFHRGDSTLEYNCFSIKEILEGQNKQFIDKWENFTIWHKVPENIEAGDRLKIYHWNPKGGNIYVDDFIVEVWTTRPKMPNGLVLSHGILEQNYETSDLKDQRTKETAARGIHACVLSGKAGKIQYGAGFRGTLADGSIKPGDFIKVSFAALKKHKVRRYEQAASMVISLEREQQQLFWEGLPIGPRLMKDGKQAFNEWVRLELWKEIPADAKSTDFLKIYPWNGQQHDIYVDDLLVEVWQKPRPSVKGN